MRRTGLAVVVACGPVVAIQPGEERSEAEVASVPPPAFPHPLITEVLYAVPREGGDANGDGTRSATGDEFIELVNPHEESIELGGYTLSDRNPEGKGRLEFRFPSLRLEPGEVVVVFNGYESSWRGPVGTARGRAGERDAALGGAWVFTMEVDSSRRALSNGGDWVLLSDPGGNPVHLVRWGDFEERPPRVPLVERAPARPKGSAARATASGPLTSHASLSRLPYSPGRFPPPTGP